MDTEGYPEESELDLIEKWDYNDVFNLLDYVRDRWAYNDCFRAEWDKDNFLKSPTLILELVTCGWSGNESIINALLRNDFINHFCYAEWKRGGYHKFEIKAQSIGFIPVAEMAKKKKISRQRIHHSAHLYDWITMGKRNKLVREKK